MKKKITIAGAGIAGLTASINLAKNDYEVEIHEIKNSCGKFSSDFQYLENWTSKENILDIMKKMNLKIDFFHKPCKKMESYSPSLNVVKLESKKPFMYAIKRGPKQNSLDSSLKNQAMKNGVKIIFNSKIKKTDIIATGPKKPMAIASGICFKTNLKDRIMIILNDDLSPKGYSYFSIHDGNAVLVCGMSNINQEYNIKKLDLKKTIEEFRKIVNFKITNPKKFGGYCYFNIPETASKNGSLYVGEAAGFQDFLAAFGMKYAMVSGFLAAKSIIEDLNYDELWRKDFLNTLKTSLNNRLVFNMLSNGGYEKAIKILRKYWSIPILRNNIDLQKALRILYTRQKFSSTCYSILHKLGKI